MGNVYKAIQRPLNRVVAVKVLNSLGTSRPDYRNRFFLEASLCARLSHPNIVRIYDFGTDRDTTYYIAMEYLEGETLKARIDREGALLTTLAIELLSQVCSALADSVALEGCWLAFATAARCSSPPP